jgi:hypothetical protein
MNNLGLFEHLVAQGGLSSIDERQKDDLFIACASFEERSTGLANCMTGNYRVKRSAIYVNSEFQELRATRESINAIETKLRNASDDYIGLRVGSWADAIKQFQVLRELIAPTGVSNEPTRVTVDITTFNRESLLACLTILHWAYPKGAVRLGYISPKEYNPAARVALRALELEAARTQTEGFEQHVSASETHKHLWLSRGFRCIRNAIGFPGLQRQNLPALLILLPGYEIERALTIVNAIEPAQVMLGRPIDATRDMFYDRSLEAKAQMVKLFKSRQPVREFDFSCKSIDTTLRSISEIAATYYKTHNIYMTSLSTKPTVVAMFLAALKYNTVQITCSVPRDYNIDDYSTGMHEVSFFNLSKS